MQSKLHFWAVLGPSIVILTLLINVIKFSPESFYLPLAVVIGLPICWIWKLRGMVLSIVFLFFLLLLSYGSIDADERFWHLGVSLAIALSFIVAALSLEELQALTQKIQVESKSRMEHLMRLDEKLKSMEKEFSLQEEEWTLQIQTLQKELEESHIELLTFRKASDAMHQELSSFEEEKKKLLEDLLESKERSFQLEFDLKKAESSQEKTSKRNRFEEIDRSLFLKLRDLQDSENRNCFLGEAKDYFTSRQVYTQMEMQKKLRVQGKLFDESKRAKASLVERLERVELEFRGTIHKAKEKERENKELQRALERLQASPPSQNKNPLSQDISSLYKQLKSQFDEKSEVLHLTRKDLFHKENELLALQRENILKSLERNEWEFLLEKKIMQVSDEKEICLQEIDMLSELIGTILKQS